MIIIEAQFLIHIYDLWSIFSLIHGGVHCGLEGELHILGKVVLEVKVTIPCKVFREGQIHIRSTRCLYTKVAHLHMRISTVHIRVERP